MRTKAPQPSETAIVITITEPSSTRGGAFKAWFLNIRRRSTWGRSASGSFTSGVVSAEEATNDGEKHQDEIESVPAFLHRMRPEDLGGEGEEGGDDDEDESSCNDQQDDEEDAGVE